MKPGKARNHGSQSISACIYYSEDSLLQCLFYGSSMTTNKKGVPLEVREISQCNERQ